MTQILPNKNSLTNRSTSETTEVEWGARRGEKLHAEPSSSTLRSENDEGAQDDRVLNEHLDSMLQRLTGKSAAEILAPRKNLMTTVDGTSTPQPAARRPTRPVERREDILELRRVANQHASHMIRVHSQKRQVELLGQLFWNAVTVSVAAMSLAIYSHWTRAPWALSVIAFGCGMVAISIGYGLKYCLTHRRVKAAAFQG